MDVCLPSLYMYHTQHIPFKTLFTFMSLECIVISIRKHGNIFTGTFYLWARHGELIPLNSKSYYSSLFSSLKLFIDGIGKTLVRIIIWCPTAKMLIKECFLIQPLEQEGSWQKCCISLCSKVFINHFYEMKVSPQCLNILIYWSIYLVDRLRRSIRRKV